MSKKKPCGLDYCPQEEIIGAYASCLACAWGTCKDDISQWFDDDDESEKKQKRNDNGKD